MASVGRACLTDHEIAEGLLKLWRKERACRLMRAKARKASQSPQRDRADGAIPKSHLEAFDDHAFEDRSPDPVP